MGDSIRDEPAALAVGEHAFHAAGVDCRDKTCVADLLYDSPADALADRGAVSGFLVRGCRGISATLEPPTRASPHQPVPPTRSIIIAPRVQHRSR